MDSEENETSCSACQEINGDPIRIACGHSFCLKCIQQVAGNNGKFPCPVCRFDVDLTLTNVDKLLNNVVFCNVIEARDTKEPSMCLDHNKSFDLFCHGCDAVICYKCLLMHHKGHAIEDIEIIFIERNKQLGAFLESTKHLASMAQDKCDAVKQSRISMEKNIDSISKTVENTFKKWNDALQKQQNVIFSYLHQERDQKRQVFVEAERILADTMTTVTRLDTEINKLRSKDTAFVVQQYGSIKARQEDTERKVLQEIETCFEPPNTLAIEVYAPWIEEAIHNIKHIDMKQTQATPGRQTIAEIQEEKVILKSDINELRNKILGMGILMAALDEYVTSKTTNISLDIPNDIQLDPRLVLEHGQAKRIAQEFEKKERETRQVQVENKYLKLILDDLHKSIILGEATLQMELKPPEDIKNDKLLMELTTNTRQINLKFYELETELDYIQRTISQLTSMIVGDDRSKDQTQEKTNKFTATGRQPKRNPARKFEQREQSSKIDKDIELVTSVWRNLKEKEMETRRLHIENQYLKLILDRIHRIINVGEARSNIELKPPEDLENDQSVNELTTNLANVELKFYDLERELDYIHVKISELANMIAGGEGSDVTLSPEMANQCKALGLKPRCNPAEANKQSERSFKLDKDLERVTSSWRDMKEKNTEKIKRLKDRIEHLESLIKNLYDHVDTAAEGSDQPPESSVANIYQYIQYIYERIMKLESSNKEYAETNFYLEEILAALDSYCSSKTETKDNRLGKGNTFASRCSGEYKRAEQIADRFKEMKKEKFILEERNKTMQNSISCLQKEKVDMNGKYQRMKEEQKQQNQEITRLRHAEERLLTRLNKIAGDRFTHDNVNIADFSDTDRPMKLSETYSELYDNEWTDAFDELTENMKLSDEAAIRLLLKILMNAFRKCKEVTWDRYESLKLVASCLDVKQEQLPSMTTEEEQICMQSTSLTSTLSIDQEKSLKKIWRTATIYLKDEMLKLLCANLLTCLGKPETEMPKTSKYLTCCTELCWKMGVQEKPMHLDVNAEKQVGEEKQFDTDRFRAYTKTGKSVAYVVWPAMFLHEGGAMLAKGRAQGCQKRVSSKE